MAGGCDTGLVVLGGIKDGSWVFFLVSAVCLGTAIWREELWLEVAVNSARCTGVVVIWAVAQYSTCSPPVIPLSVKRTFVWAHRESLGNLFTIVAPPMTSD